MTSFSLPGLPPAGPRMVGLTGGIASGKSLAREMFEQLGVPCIDADKVARAIHQNPAHLAMKEIAKAFPSMITDAGVLKRGSLQSLFAINAKANRRLKSILKPHVMGTICRWAEEQRKPYIICESALILDENIPVDRILVVDAAEDRKIARMRIRNPDWSDAEVRNILVLQLPCEVYLAQAQDVIHNDGSAAELKQQVKTLHQQYMNLWELK